MTANAPADIPRAYNAADVEQRIYQTWLDQGYFTPVVDPDKTPFTIIMPPPNVTGELHRGARRRAARWRPKSRGNSDDQEPEAPVLGRSGEGHV